MGVIGILSVIIGTIAVVYYIKVHLTEKAKYNLDLTVFKEIGNHTIKELNFKVKRAKMPIDPSNLDNKEWFLITKKVGGMRYYWPYYSPEYWMTDTHCFLYSKTQKGNNWAMLLDKPTTFVESIKKWWKGDGTFDYDIVMKDDDSGEITPAQMKVTNDSISVVQTGEEVAPIIFPKSAHELKAKFAEETLPNVIGLQSTIDKLHDPRDWWEKYGSMALLGLMAIVLIANSAIVWNFISEGPFEYIHHLEITSTPDGVTGVNLETSPNEDYVPVDVPEDPPGEGYLDKGFDMVLDRE